MPSKPCRRREAEDGQSQQAGGLAGRAREMVMGGWVDLIPTVPGLAPGVSMGIPGLAAGVSMDSGPGGGSALAPHVSDG
jgi:hypothetical protein